MVMGCHKSNGIEVHLNILDHSVREGYVITDEVIV